MLKNAMPPQDPAVLGRVLWRETPIYHKIRLATARRTKTDGTPWPSPRNNCHQDNPGDPDDGSSSDETYLPSSNSNTESDVTDLESREQSSRAMPHHRSDDEH